MTIITDISIATDDFALGNLFDIHPEITIVLERLVPLQRERIPLLWIHGIEPAAIVSDIQNDDLIDSATVLTELDEKFLVEVSWHRDIESVVRPLIESDADILRGTGTSDSWDFQIQLADRDRLQQFRDRCEGADIDVTFRSIYDPTEVAKPSSETLTDEQYEAIVCAYENGYWKIPREITMGELADQIGVSSNAASQRMRRGMESIVREWLSPDQFQSDDSLTLGAHQSQKRDRT